MGSRFAVRGRLVVDGRLVPGAVVVEGGVIKEVQRGEPAAGNLPAEVVTASVVAPGFIDLQVNGGFGFEVGTDVEALRGLSNALPRTGVTAWLPTVVSSEPDVYPLAFAAFASAKGAPGAVAAGCTSKGHSSPPSARARTGCASSRKHPRACSTPGWPARTCAS